MTFKEAKTNKRLVEKLSKAIRSEDLHHAYILEGPRNAGKEAFALDFAKAIMCKEEVGIGCGRCPTCKKIASGNHIDLTMIKAEGSKSSKVKSIKDKNVEELQSRLRSKPYDGDRNIAIIVNADTMTQRAFNRLLKTLEEPPAGTVIMLLSENIKSMPETIVSRAVHLRLQVEDNEETSEARKKAMKMVRLLEDREPYYKTKKAIEEITKAKDVDREQVYEILDCMEEIYRNYLLETGGPIKKEHVFTAIQAIEEARKDIIRKINTTYSIKNMALTIGG